MVLQDAALLNVDSLVIWLAVVLIVLAAGMLFALLACTVSRRSVTEGWSAWWRHLVESFTDLTGFSGRRIMNLARLSVKESIHRGVLYAFVVFAILFLFAGWYIDSGGREQVKVYVTFVLKVTGVLTLLLALLLSCFSLPADIKGRTIHTVVTKPVRRSEIVLGRIVGFTGLGTLILLLMGGVSLAFVYRGVDHRHSTPGARSHRDPLDPKQLVFYEGTTALAEDHRHTVRLDAGGNGHTDEAAAHQHQVVDFKLQPAQGHTHPFDRPAPSRSQGQTTENNGHWHLISVDREGNGMTDRRLGHYHQISNFVVGRPEDQLVARVPMYGNLHFRGRQREEREKGVNTGDIWDYRTFIEGGTPMAAIWDFHALDRDQLAADGLYLEMTFEVYRSHKGKMNDSVLAEFVLVNPDNTDRRSRPILLGVQEGHMNTLQVPRKETDAQGNPIDVYDDLITRDGRLSIEVSCATPEQYLGMAQADLWLRAGNRSFVLNFVKCLACIWLQMVLIVCVGVVTSTFLSGPMAGLTTLAIVLSGLTMPFIKDVAMGNMPGPLESIIRLIGGQSELAPLDPTPWIRTAFDIDKGLIGMIRGMTLTLPDLGSLGTAAFVSNGFDIPLWPSSVQGRGLALHVLWTLGYCVPYTLIGYFSLRSREIAL